MVSRLYLKGVYSADKVPNRPLPSAIVFTLIEVSLKRGRKGLDVVILLAF